MQKVRIILIAIFVGIFALSCGSVFSEEASAAQKSVIHTINASYFEEKDGFRAQFWVTEHADVFQHWSTVNLADLDAIPSVVGDEPLYIGLFIIDPEVGLDGASNVTFDYEVIKPDGGVYGGGKNATGWKKKAPERLHVEMLDSRMKLNFAPSDPKGVYVINMIVHDNIRNVVIPLERKVMLVDAPPNKSSGLNTAILDKDKSGQMEKPRGILLENNELEMNDGFGAQFWITDNERFFINWVKADVGNLNSVSVAVRNHPVYIALFFVDPSAGLDGMVNVTFDVKVIKPDGVIYGGGRGIACWAGEPPAPHLVQLGMGRVSVTFEVIDPVGLYTFSILVHDNVRKISVPLERKILLRE